MTTKMSYTNQQINSIVPASGVDGNFIYYSFVPRKRELLSLASAKGVRTPILNKSDFCALTILLPPLAIQKKISAVLSAYDDLIENNTRRIKILEEMAQAIYREWFVEFRAPGVKLRKATEKEKKVTGKDHFPEGWKLDEMDAICDVIDCLHSKKPLHTSEGVGMLLQLNNIGENGKLIMDKKYLISEADYKRWTSRIEVKSGDCVITNVGRIAAIAQVPDSIVAALGRNMTGLRAKPGRITPTNLIQYLLSEHMEREVSVKKDAGAIMDSLNVRGIKRLIVPMAPALIMSKFESLVRPFRRLIENLVSQQACLQSARDILLPKLISGELDVSELDIEVKEKIA